MKKRSLSTRQKGQRGQSLVEMALSMVVILMLLAGAINFGIAFLSYVAIRDAAQEGALYASLDPTGDIEGRVRSSSTAPVNLADETAVDVIVTPLGSLCEGHYITVTVRYDCPVTMPFASIFTGSTIPLEASATSVILQPKCPSP